MANAKAKSMSKASSRSGMTRMSSVASRKSSRATSVASEVSEVSALSEATSGYDDDGMDALNDMMVSQFPKNVQLKWYTAG